MHEESSQGRHADNAERIARKRYRALRQSAFDEAGSSHVSYPVPDGDGGAVFFSYRRLDSGQYRISSCFGIRQSGATPIYDEKAIFADACNEAARARRHDEPHNTGRLRANRGHHIDRLATAYEACTSGNETALAEYAEAVSCVEPGDLLPFYAKLGLPVRL